jgi:hypothetical protein
MKYKTMKYLKKYEGFKSGTQDSPSRVTTKPDTETPTRKKPSRPGIVPIDKPGTEDAPLALKQKGPESTLEGVFKRLVSITKEEGIDLKKLIK